MWFNSAPYLVAGMMLVGHIMSELDEFPRHYFDISLGDIMVALLSVLIEVKQILNKAFL